MQKTSFFPRLVPIIACWLFTVACGVSGESPRQVQQQPNVKLKQAWKLQVQENIQAAKTEKSPQKGGFYFNEVMILKSLLNETASNDLDAEFQRICAADVIHDYSNNDTDLDGNYDAFLLEAFVARIIENKDAPHLITLLNRHCPRHIVYSPLEFFLSYRWPGAIERLFDCYATAKSPVAKNDIAFCLRRAFPSFRDRFSADDEFVKQAQRWYLANSSKLQVNTRYQYLVSLPPPQPGEDRTNLFVYQAK